MRSFKFFLTLALCALIAIGLAACGTNADLESIAEPAVEHAAVAREAKPGQLAPEFEVRGLDGTNISFEDIEGNPAVLVFWTAWCPSCKEEAPALNKLAES
ncbi:MAG: redoxin domain-containing protein, partial [Pyrinomonadaceae bacterium]